MTKIYDVNINKLNYCIHLRGKNGQHQRDTNINSRDDFYSFNIVQNASAVVYSFLDHIVAFV